MLQNILIELFERDLTKLKTEINAYTDDEKFWKIDKEIKNSAGNLCLHLVGNLRQFIGGTLGNTGYKRDRDNEFIIKNVSRIKILNEIDVTIEEIKKTLSSLPDDIFSKDYPSNVFKRKMSTEYFLIHLTAHLNYHLGQINYHRRLI